MTTTSNQTVECSIPDCPCCEFNRQDAPHVHDYQIVAGQSVLECACGAVRSYPELDAALTEEDRQLIIGAIPLDAFPVEHPPLRSLQQAHDDELYDTYRRGYADGWADAQMERLRAENEDLRAIAGERMEGQ